MTFRYLYSLHVFVILCERLALAATDIGNVSAVNASSTTMEPFNKATPAPGGLGATEEASLQPTVVSVETATENAMATASQDSMGTPLSEAPTAVTDAPSTTTAQTVISAGCLCDLTPDICDIGCCCDTADCGVADLTTVFSGCPQELVKGDCVEKWLMFRANVDSALITVTDTLFCVRPQVSAAQSFSAVHQYPALGDSYHFSPGGHSYTRHSRDFYRADDVIQTFFSKSSVRGLLRQPSPGVASSFCFNRNPAKFLRSSSLSCTRMVTSQSCATDPSLSANAYFSDMTLIKIPTAKTVIPSDFLIPVIPQAEWPKPGKQNNSCLNVVKKVEFIVGYTSNGELSYGRVNIDLVDLTLNQLLLQTHSIQFQITTPRPPSGGLTPSVGLLVRSPVIGQFGGEVQPLTTLWLSQGGECSPDPNGRAPVLFTHNTISGCTFSSPASNCTELRSRIYEILQGPAPPDVIAMNSGSQPDWTRVIRQECPVRLQETCESGCILPHSLSIQVLWARMGFIDHPQKYILGAKFLFHCQNVKCPLSSPLTLTTKVVFAETTVYPEAPRGLPQSHWKFPFDFFTRGAAELDGHIITNRSGTKEVTWSFILFTVLLQTESHTVDFFRLLKTR